MEGIMKSIFISSTFKDMQSERDMLQYFIYPRIRNDLRKYGEDLNILDLRWGVDTLNLSEEESGKVVLKVCIDAIDRCVPYIIVFLGERYGWIPEEDIITKTNDTRVDKHFIEGMSITNLEVEYGAFSELCSIEKCIFCFRNPSVNENIEEDYRKTYDSESEIHRQKLELLKNRIRQEKNATIIEYDAYWDLENHKIAGLEQLQEQLYASLKDKILVKFENQLQRHPYEQMKQEMELTKQQYLSTYAKRYKDENEVISEIIDKVIGEPDAKNIYIKAAGGIGKTAIMSSLAKICMDADMKTILCYGGINGCQDYHTVKEYVKYQLEELIEAEHTENAEALNERLIELDKKIAGKYKVICFLDAVDQIFDDSEIHLDLLDVCPNIIFVLSSVKEISLINDDIKCIEIDGLSDEQVSSMIINTTAKKGKTLNQEIIQKIKKRDNAGNPLYLSNLLQRLFMMSAKEFEEAENLAPGMEGIHKYMNQILDKTPDDQYEMITYLIKKAADYFQNEEFQYIISLLDASRDGLTENELSEILALKGIQFNSLLFAQMVTCLYDVFVQKVNGKWAFKHRLFRSAIKNDSDAIKLLCQYALRNDDFMEQEGLYYLAENRHEKGYLLFERYDIEKMQGLMVHLLKKDESYQKYFVDMSLKADCNICFANVCRLEHKMLNQMQEAILDKLFVSGNLSKENQIRYYFYKIGLCSLFNEKYLACIEPLKSLDEELYYSEMAYYKYGKKSDNEAEEMIQKAIQIAKQKEKNEKSVLNLCRYVSRKARIVTDYREFDPVEIEECLELLKRYRNESSSDVYKMETNLYIDLFKMYAQKRYYDAHKIMEYRNAAIKRAERLVEKIPTVDHLYLLIHAYEEALKIMKDNEQQQYAKACVKCCKRKYELTRLDKDLFHWAEKIRLYAEKMTDKEEDVIKHYKQAMSCFEKLSQKNTEASSMCKERFLITKASLALYMRKSEQWENKKKGTEILNDVAEDADFRMLKQRRMLKYLDILMEHWIKDYNYEKASLWMDTFNMLCIDMKVANKYQKALQKDGKTDQEYLTLARKLFINNIYLLSLETFERIENKDILDENDKLAILLSQYMIQYMNNQSDFVEIPDASVAGTDDYTNTISIMNSFVKMRNSDDKQFHFLKSMETLLYNLCDNKPEEEIERIVIPKLKCFLAEFNEFENIDIKEYGRMIYRVPLWVYTFYDDRKYVKDLLCIFAKLYEESGIDQFTAIAETFYEMTAEKSKMPVRKQCSTENIKEYYDSNVEKLKRVVRIYTH